MTHFDLHATRPAWNIAPARTTRNRRSACRPCWQALEAPRVRRAAVAATRRSARASRCCACTSASYFDAVRAKPRRTSGYRALDGGDTIMSPGTWEAVMRCVGAACAAVDAVVDGAARNAFCATRPCGHHAEADRAMGFCVFNQAAIAALHARARAWPAAHGGGGLRRAPRQRHAEQLLATTPTCSTAPATRRPSTRAPARAASAALPATSSTSRCSAAATRRRSAAACATQMLPALRALRARTADHLRRLRRPPPRPAGRAGVDRRRLPLDHARADGGGRRMRAGPRGLDARRRLQPGGPGQRHARRMCARLMQA